MVSRRTTESSQQSIVQFGEFSLDIERGELKRLGVPVTIAPQPLRALVKLVASAGELVTRETMIKAIWGANSYPETEDSLNHCIARLRSVLDDNASSPAFIATVPRRGYRFVANTTTVTISMDTPIDIAPKRISVALFPFAAYVPDRPLFAEVLFETVLRICREESHGSLCLIDAERCMASQTALEVKYCVCGCVEFCGSAMCISFHICDYPCWVVSHCVSFEVCEDGIADVKQLIAQRVVRELLQHCLL